jgi:hypothetical protein
LCIGEEEQDDAKYTYNPNKNTAHPLDPSPSHVFRDEPANDRAKDGTKKGGNTVKCHGQASLSRREEVRDSATRVDQRRPTKGAAKETQYHERGNISASGRTSDEGHHGDVGGDPEDLSSIELRSLGQHRWQLALKYSISAYGYGT